MKKDEHYWNVLRKDGEACAQITRNMIENLKAEAEHPGFREQYAAELAQRGLQNGGFQTAVALPAAA